MGDRPSGITAVGILLIIGGIINLILAFKLPLAFIFGKVFFGGKGILIYLILSAVLISSGIGLLRLKKWALPLAIGIEIFGIVNMIFVYALSINIRASPEIQSAIIFRMGNLINVAVLIPLLGYLYRNRDKPELISDKYVLPFFIIGAVLAGVDLALQVYSRSGGALHSDVMMELYKILGVVSWFEISPFKILFLLLVNVIRISEIYTYVSSGINVISIVLLVLAVYGIYRVENWGILLGLILIILGLAGDAVMYYRNIPALSQYVFILVQGMPVVIFNSIVITYLIFKRDLFFSGGEFFEDYSEEL